MSDTAPGRRHDGLPSELSAILLARDESSREAAWERFVEQYSKLILHAAHSQASNYDGAMNRYAFVLQKLRENDFHRLEQFASNGRARFSTWLVVVARRLCVDYIRSRYGRDRGTRLTNGIDPLAVRRRLAGMLAEELDVDRIGDPSLADPEHDLRISQLHDALLTAVQRQTPRDRLLLKLRFHDEMTAREISELMEFPTLFHVYRRIKKVLGELQQDLVSQGFRGPEP